MQLSRFPRLFDTRAQRIFYEELGRYTLADAVIAQRVPQAIAASPLRATQLETPIPHKN